MMRLLQICENQEKAQMEAETAQNHRILLKLGLNAEQ
jgi:hypothetical protein